MAAAERDLERELGNLRSRLEAKRRGPLAHGSHGGGESGEGGGGSSSAAAVDDEWTLVGFIDSLGISECIADALLKAEHEQRAGGWFGDASARPKTDLELVRALAASNDGVDGMRKALLALLQRAGTLDQIASVMGKGIEALANSPSGGGAELGRWSSGKLNKFLHDEGGLMMSYASLNTFFLGLEGKVGSPSPQVEEAIRAEHVARGDSRSEFTAGNYGVVTTSEVEYQFVAEQHHVPRRRPGDGQPGWPVETKNTELHGESIARQPISTVELLARMQVRNARLRVLGEPELQYVEALTARLYTGPLFAKYNAILRGLETEVPFLRNQMVELCCPPQVYQSYMGGAKVGETPRDGQVSYEVIVSTHLNKYTTTLHAINSAIVKLSKLTYASKVYRGIHNRVLPKQFWEANEYGVRGGIEAAFMSTTTDKEVALGYARGGGDASAAGIVFEVQQGMVDRGADLSTLSQYPHEREILFAPLTGFEVKYTRVEDQVLVVVVGLSVNLTAQTLEQVVSKRRKLMCDMCDELIVQARYSTSQSEEWALLRQVKGEGAVDAADRMLRSFRGAIEAEQPEHFNDNQKLLDATSDALGIANSVAGWGSGLHELLLDWQALNMERNSLEGLLTTAELDLSNRKLELNAAYGAAGLVIFNPHLTNLILVNNPLGDAGVAAIASALAASPQSRLEELTLQHTHAGERAAKALVTMLEANKSLDKLNVSRNPDLEACKAACATLRQLSDEKNQREQRRRKFLLIM